jgi:hypothetical protein
MLYIMPYQIYDELEERDEERGEKQVVSLQPTFNWLQHKFQ